MRVWQGLRLFCIVSSTCDTSVKTSCTFSYPWYKVVQEHKNNMFCIYFVWIWDTLVSIWFSGALKTDRSFLVWKSRENKGQEGRKRRRKGNVGIGRGRGRQVEVDWSCPYFGIRQLLYNNKVGEKAGSASETTGWPTGYWLAGYRLRWPTPCHRKEEFAANQNTDFIHLFVLHTSFKAFSNPYYISSIWQLQFK